MMNSSDNNQEKAFKEDAVIIVERIGQIDLPSAYDINHFLEDPNIIALIEYEYARLTEQNVVQARLDLHITNIIDDSQIEGWSQENLNKRSEKIQIAINNAVSGHPSFLMIADGLHWISIGLLPDQNTQGILNVVYMNSAYGEGAEQYLACKATGLDFLKNLIDMIEATENAMDQSHELKAKITQIYSDPTQQLGNNCGAIVALNTAFLANYWKKQNGINLNFNQFAREIAALNINKIFSITDRERKIELFTNYIQSKFTAINNLKLNEMPSGSEHSDSLETQATFTAKLLNREKIGYIKISLERRNKDKNTGRVEHLKKTDEYASSELYSKISSLPSHVISMIFEIIERNRSFMGGKIAQSYTIEELKASYDLVIAQNARLQKQMMQGDSDTRENEGNAANAKKDKGKEKQGSNPAVMNKSISLTQKHKLKDIIILEQAVELINEYISADVSLEETFPYLQKISLTISKLYFNDNREGKKEYIRNKYGSIDRSDKNKKRDNGLEIILLEALKHLSPEVFNERNITKERLNDSLIIIKNKIQFILSSEKEDLVLSNQDILNKLKELGEATWLNNFISYHYVISLIAALKTIINDEELMKLDFTQRQDRYYFGRVLSLAGELAKDIKNFINPGKEAGLFSSFKRIRDKKIAHSFSAMVKELSNEQLEHFEILRDLLKINFLAIIQEVKNKLDENYGSLSDPKKFKTLVINLGITTESENIEFNKLVKSVFGRKDIGINKEVLLSIKYQEPLATHQRGKLGNNEAEASKNKKELEASKEISEVLGRIKLIKEKVGLYYEKHNKINTDSNLKPKDKKNLSKFADKCKNEALRLIKSFNKNDIELISSFKFPSETELPTIQQIEEIIIGVEKVISLSVGVSIPHDITITPSAVKGSDVTGSPKVQKTSAKNTTINSQKDAPKHETLKDINIVLDELNFITEILKDISISNDKKAYITQFAFTKVGMVFADPKKNKNHKSTLPDLVPQEFIKSVNKTIKTRHKLMHDILSIKNLPLNQVVYRHTLPMLSEIEAIQDLLQEVLKDEDSSSRIAFVNSTLKIGRAFSILKKYDKAFECFENVLKICKDELIPLSEKLTPEENLNIWIGILTAYYAIAEAYGKAGFSELEHGNIVEANKFLKLKISNLEQCVLLTSLTPSMPSAYLATLHNNLANAYSEIEESSEAVKNHKISLMLLKKEKEYKEYKEAVYLSNLGTTLFKEHSKQLVSNYNQQYIPSEALRNISQAIACLWEAKEIFEKEKKHNTRHYIRTMLTLIKALLYSGDEINQLYAQALYVDLQVIINEFPAREKDQEVYGISSIQELIDNCPKCSGELIIKYRDQREIIDIEFKLRLLNNLKILYLELNIAHEIDNRLAELQVKYQADSPDEFSKDLQFELTIQQPNTRASELFRKGQYEKALPIYLEVLNIINSKFKKELPWCLGDILESIGDTYIKLEKHGKALEYFTKSLEAHIKYKPNDRAFDIPKKIVECNALLFEDFRERNQKLIETTFENFKKKLGSNDDRLIPLKKLICVFYLNLKGCKYKEGLIIFKEIEGYCNVEELQYFKTQVERYEDHTTNIREDTRSAQGYKTKEAEADLLNKEGKGYYLNKDFRTAAEMFFKAIQIYNTYNINNNVNLAILNFNCGKSHYHLGEYKKAEFFLRHSLTLRENHIEPRPTQDIEKTKISLEECRKAQQESFSWVDSTSKPTKNTHSRG